MSFFLRDNLRERAAAILKQRAFVDKNPVLAQQQKAENAWFQHRNQLGDDDVIAGSATMDVDVNVWNANMIEYMEDRYPGFKFILNNSTLIYSGWL